MEQKTTIPIWDIENDLWIYFYWSVNAIVPIDPHRADIYLKQHKPTIVQVAQRLLKTLQYVPELIYRGILQKKQVSTIEPVAHLQYLSFSEQRTVAEHFADTNGFGSEIMDVESQLGRYGYVIEYTPKIEEVLFHYHFFSWLPYAEAFTLMGMNGNWEVKCLLQQKEIMILQPKEPLTSITRITKQE